MINEREKKPDKRIICYRHDGTLIEVEHALNTILPTTSADLFLVCFDYISYGSLYSSYVLVFVHVPTCAYFICYPTVLSGCWIVCNSDVYYTEYGDFLFAQLARRVGHCEIYRDPLRFSFYIPAECSAELLLLYCVFVLQSVLSTIEAPYPW